MHGVVVAVECVVETRERVFAHSSPAEGEVFRAGDVVSVGVAPSCLRAPAETAGWDNIPREPRQASSETVKQRGGARLTCPLTS